MSIISPRLRFEVLSRDRFTCQACARTAAAGIELVVGFWDPEYRHEPLDPDNLTTLCAECWQGKSALEREARSGKQRVSIVGRLEGVGT